jgi:hypothetical protein
MEIKKILTILMVFTIVTIENSLFGQILNVPSDFPQYKITVNNSPDDGYFFLAADQMPNKQPGYLIMLDNYGTPVYYRYFNKVLNSFGVQKSGLLSFMARGAAGVKFYLMDSTFTIVDSLVAKAPYTKTDPHDFQALKNGHFVFLVNDARTMDMTTYGGKVNATVTGCVVQEQDENKNVVFNWNSWDHYQISDSYADLTASNVDLIHHNSIDVDEEGNFFLSSRSLNEITKINRQTGEMIWRLGGKNNQFTFTDPISIYSMPHDFRKTSNGNFTIFDNGNERNPAYSRALEYTIDQTNKIVNLVSNFDLNKKIYADNSGSSTKLETGNTVMGFGYNMSNPAIIEVHPDSSIAFRLELPNQVTSYRVFKSPWKNTLFEPSTNSIDFGEWDGYTTAEYLLVMKNNSNNVVTLTSYSTHTNAFRIDNTFPIDIPAKGQVILTVTYYPSSIQTGFIKDILTINSDINTSNLVQRIAQQIKLTGKKYDVTAPLASISIAGKNNMPQDTIIYINFNEPIRWINNTECNYKNVDTLVVFKKDNISGENVPFDAVISTDKNKITIKPKFILDHTQKYYVAVLSKFEDYSDNKGTGVEATFNTIDLTSPTGIFTPQSGATGINPTSSITLQYNEPIRHLDNSELTNSDLNSLIVFKLNDANGADVNFTATINTEKTIITISPSNILPSNSTFYISIGDVVEDNNNNKAAAVNSFFTTSNATAIAPDLSNNKIEVFPNPSDGLFRIQIPENKLAHLKVTNINGSVVYDKFNNGVISNFIDLSKFPDGFYFLYIEIDGTPASQIFKLVKQHE